MNVMYNYGSSNTEVVNMHVLKINYELFDQFKMLALAIVFTK